MNKIKNVALMAISAWVSKLLIAVVGFFAIPYLIKILGNDNYALFALLAGLSPWLLLSDFGIGYSLQNNISKARANREGINKYIITSVYILLPLTVISVVVIFWVSEIIGPVYLKVGSSQLNIAQREIYFLIACLIFLFSAIGGVSSKILYGIHKGWWSNLAAAAGGIVGLTLILFFDFSGCNQEYLPLIYLAVFFMPGILISLVILIFLVIRAFLQSNEKISKDQIIETLKSAKYFWFFSITATITLQSDYIVLSQKMASREIALYTVLMKIYGVAMFIYSAILQAAWPICSEFAALGNWEGVKKLLNRSLYMGVLIILSATIILYLFNNGISAAIGFSEPIPRDMILLFSLYFVCRVWSDSYSMVMQSTNLMRPLMIFAPVQAILSILLQWIFAGYWGLYGIILGLIMSFALTVVPALPVFLRKKLKSF